MKIYNTLLLVFLFNVLCLIENIGSKSSTKLQSNLSKGKLNLNNKISIKSYKQANGQVKKCPEPKYVDDKQVNSLITDLSRSKDDQEKLTVIDEFISKNEGKPISAQNSIKIIQNLKINKRLPYALDVLKSLFSITSKDLQTIVKNAKNKSNQIEILESLLVSLMDKDTVILEGLLNDLECEEKTKFRVILEKSKPKDCFFGDLNINKVVFIFDLSGSMDEMFTFDNRKYSRLEFLKENFIQAFENFDENQYYQIVVFGQQARYLHGGSGKLIQATEENLSKTVDLVYKLEAQGRTNIGEGLRLAYAINDNIDEIFLFSDGAPTVGLETVQEFKDFISEQNKLRLSKKLNKPKINVNLLMLGGGESSQDRKEANLISTTIASSTGGVVKYYGKD